MCPYSKDACVGAFSHSVSHYCAVIDIVRMEWANGDVCGIRSSYKLEPCPSYILGYVDFVLSQYSIDIFFRWRLPVKIDVG